MANSFDLGSCCICEVNDDTVRNAIQLDFKVFGSETCWGCFRCGLPMEGAVAALCDACFEKYRDDPDMEAHITFLMDTADRRIPVPPVAARVPHKHDLSKHPEVPDDYYDA